MATALNEQEVKQERITATYDEKLSEKDKLFNTILQQNRDINKLIEEMLLDDLNTQEAPGTSIDSDTAIKNDGAKKEETSEMRGISRTSEKESEEDSDDSSDSFESYTSERVPAKVCD